MVKYHADMQRKLNRLPVGKKFKRLCDLFSEDFIKELDIEPWVYHKVNQTEPEEGKENRGNRGIRMKRQFVHNIFCFFFETVIDTIIKTNQTYVSPLCIKKTYIFVGKKPDHEINYLFSKNTGIYTDLNPIEQDFLLYNVFIKTRSNAKFFPIQINYNDYKRLLKRIKDGQRYFDVYPDVKRDMNLLKTKDIQDTIFEVYPNLDVSVFKRIVEVGFIRINEIKSTFCPIHIHNRMYGINYKF